MAIIPVYGAFFIMKHRDAEEEPVLYLTKKK